jgi:hypothetical protein
MRSFPTPQSLAECLVKSYYATAVYDSGNLFKFYASDAVIVRDGIVTREPVSIKTTRLLIMNLPADSILSVVNFTAALLDGIECHVTVNGLAELPSGRRSFSQHFILREIAGKLWIALDTLAFLSDDIFDQTVPGDYFAIAGSDAPPPPQQQPADGAAPAERPPPAKQARGRKGKRGRGRGVPEKFAWKSPND